MGAVWCSTSQDKDIEADNVLKGCRLFPCAGVLPDMPRNTQHSHTVCQPTCDLTQRSTNMLLSATGVRPCPHWTHVQGHRELVLAECEDGCPRSRTLAPLTAFWAVFDDGIQDQSSLNERPQPHVCCWVSLSISRSLNHNTRQLGLGYQGI